MPIARSCPGVLVARAVGWNTTAGVVYGLAAFLFVSGLLRQQRTLMGLSLLVVFLYGGMLWGVFPIVPRISWESHFWGAAAGLARLLRWSRVADHGGGSHLACFFSSSADSSVSTGIASASGTKAPARSAKPSALEKVPLAMVRKWVVG